MEKELIKKRLEALRAKTAPAKPRRAGAAQKDASAENENFAELSGYVYSEIVRADGR